MILVATSSHGAGVSPDSVDYVSAARNLARGLGLVTYTGTSLVAFPPLLPAILSVGEMAGIGAYETSRILNATAFGGIALLTAGLARATLGESRWPFLASVVAVVSIPLVYVARYVWTESLFILLELGFLIEAIRYAKTSRWRHLAIATVLAALGTLTRYVGVVWLAVLGAVILAWSRGRWWSRLLRASAYPCVASLPLIAWLLRNQALSGTLAGARAPSSLSVGENLARTVQTLVAWWIPSPPITTWGILAGVVVASSAVVLLVLVVTNLSKGTKGVGATHPGLLIVALSVLAYVAYLVMAATLIAFNAIGDRLLSPIAPLVIILALWVSRAIMAWARARWALSERRSPNLAVSAYALVAICLIYPSVRSATLLASSYVLGNGYAQDHYLHSETAQLASMQCQGLPTYSNADDALYWAEGIQAERVPRRTAHASDAKADDMADFEQFAAQEPLCVVWLDARPRSYLIPEKQVIALLRNTEVIRAEDGSIYLSSPD